MDNNGVWSNPFWSEESKSHLSFKILVSSSNKLRCWGTSRWSSGSWRPTFLQYYPWIKFETKSWSLGGFRPLRLKWDIPNPIIIQNMTLKPKIFLEEGPCKWQKTFTSKIKSNLNVVSPRKILDYKDVICLFKGVGWFYVNIRDVQKSNVGLTTI